MSMKGERLRKSDKKLDFRVLKYYFGYQKVNMFVSSFSLYSCYKSYLFLKQMNASGRLKNKLEKGT